MQHGAAPCPACGAPYWVASQSCAKCGWRTAPYPGGASGFSLSPQQRPWPKNAAGGPIPRATPADQPPAYWTAENLRIPFGDPAVLTDYDQVFYPPIAPGANTGGDVITRGIWTSPVFNLDPGLEASASNTPVGVPIYRPSPTLTVQSRILDDGAKGNEISVYAVEFASTRQTSSGSSNVGAQVFPISPPRDISTAWWDQSRFLAPGTVTETGISELEFGPPGGPIRFWQLHLVFDRRSGAANPILTINAAMY